MVTKIQPQSAFGLIEPSKKAEFGLKPSLNQVQLKIHHALKRVKLSTDGLKMSDSSRIAMNIFEIFGGEPYIFFEFRLNMWYGVSVNTIIAPKQRLIRSEIGLVIMKENNNQWRATGLQQQAGTELHESAVSCSGRSIS